MKYTLVILLFSIITLFCPSKSKANNIGITTIKAKLNGNYSVEQREEISEILENRFKNFSKKDVNIQIENDSIIIKVFMKMESRYCMDLITKKGELLVLKPYSRKDVYPYLQQIDSLLNTTEFKTVKNEMNNAYTKKNADIVLAERYDEVTEQPIEIVEYADEGSHVKFEPPVVQAANYDEHNANEIYITKFDDYTEPTYYYDDNNPLFKIMEPNITGKLGDAIIASSLEKDTAKVNKLFSNATIKKYLPPDIRFIWKTNDNWYNAYVTLFAIKKPTVDTEYITNYMIESTKLTRPYGYNIESNILFKKEYHALWRKITMDNIGQQILVIMDNEVLMCPHVNSIIEEGNVAISGGTDNTNNKVLSAILNSGLLNADIEVLEITYDYPPMYYLMKLFN